MTPSSRDAKTYDVALSFAGEDRPYVRQVAEYLRMRGVRVFYDQFEQTSLWGQDLVEALDRVYRLDSTFVVMFISLAYRDKEWTRHERRSALSAALASPDEYVLPARFDSTELPGLRPSIGYVSLQDVAPTALGEVIVAKLRKRGVYVHEGILRLSQGGYLGWRVLARKYDPLSAQGAALFGGRWNHPGERVLYVAPSLCNALFEVIIHLAPQAQPEYVAARIRIPEGVAVQTIYSTALPPGWQTQQDITRKIGSEWYKSRNSGILSVPSAVLPEDRFFLLNTEHHDFAHVQVITADSVELDNRLLSIGDPP